MRSRSIAFRTAGVAAVLVMAPAAVGAYAQDSVTVTAYPAEVRPGGEVEIRVQGCAGTTGTARSGAFDGEARLHGGTRANEQRPDEQRPDEPGAGRDDESGTGSGRGDESGTGSGRDDESGTRREGGHGSHTLSGTTGVKSRLSPGAHHITVHCDGRVHHASGTLRVVRDHARPGEPSPTAPVRAGGGGTATLAAAEQRRAEETEGAGPGTPHTVVGLVLAGAAALAVALRSSRRRQTGG
ncbi:hypothetical protein [Streptomyces sp. NPDC001889]